MSAYEPIQLEPVRLKKEIRLWNEYIERYHTLGYKRPFGAHQRYFIWSRTLNRRLGCMLFSACAWALAERDAWIGWSKEDRGQRLSYIVNNTRFLIFPWVKVKNLASKALALAVRQVPIDWQERYGFTPVLWKPLWISLNIKALATKQRTGCCWEKPRDGTNGSVYPIIYLPPSISTCIRFAATSGRFYAGKARASNERNHSINGRRSNPF